MDGEKHSIDCFISHHGLGRASRATAVFSLVPVSAITLFRGKIDRAPLDR
ncbi:MAG: hypothetical protein JRJ29_07285 [Deltaproteobacteria bacterium]|nr:hypothetical protein [Deltaproteobacteria bacterium]